MKKTILLFGLVVYSSLSFACKEEKVTCDYPDYKCPSGYRCQIRWGAGPYQCVKGQTSVLKSLSFMTSLDQTEEKIYLLRTKIGKKQFNDFLILNKNGSGSITVPGVFTASIFDFREQYRWAGSEIDFKIKVNENNTEKVFVYDLFIYNDMKRTVIGKVRDEFGQVVGDILEGSKAYEFPNLPR